MHLVVVISLNESRKTRISLNILGWFVLIVFFCQVYDENDYRRARFVGRQKEVSELLKCREDVCIY